MVGLPCSSQQLLAQQLTNDHLSLTVNAEEGSYQLLLHEGHDGQPVLKSRVAGQVDHEWLRSSDYPRHQASESTFEDDLGSGRQVTVTCSGLGGKPDLVYVIQIYTQRPYGTVQVKVRNSLGREVTVQAIRSVEAIGEPMLNLGGSQSADRILSDSFSEDWPDLALYDLGSTRTGCIALLAANSSTIARAIRAYFSARSPRSLSDPAAAASLRAPAMQPKLPPMRSIPPGPPRWPKEFSEAFFRGRPSGVESAALNFGAELSSERVLFSLGTDYHRQLETYGCDPEDSSSANLCASADGLVELDCLLLWIK